MGNDKYHWMISYRYQGYSNFANLTGDRNDEMDSWANKSPNYSGCMTGDANGGGDRQVARYNTWDNDVAPWNSDEVSSYRTAFGCG